MRRTKARYAFYFVCFVVLAGLLWTCAITLREITQYRRVVTRIGASPMGKHAHVISERWSADSAAFAVDDGVSVIRLKARRAMCTPDTSLYEGTVRWAVVEHATFLWVKHAEARIWYNPKSAVFGDADVDSVARRIPVTSTNHPLPPREVVMTDIPQLSDERNLAPPIIPYKPPQGSNNEERNAYVRPARSSTSPLSFRTIHSLQPLPPNADTVLRPIPYKPPAVYPDSENEGARRWRRAVYDEPVPLATGFRSDGADFSDTLPESVAAEDSAAADSVDGRR